MESTTALIAAAEYDEAVLYNGLGQYELALKAAQKAHAADDIVTSSWALFELVEAASRSGRHEIARDAAERLAERTSVSGTAWAKGTEARSRALVEDGETADGLHREAIESLRQRSHVLPQPRYVDRNPEWNLIARLRGFG